MPFDIEAARTTLQDVQPKDAGALRERVVQLATPRLSGTEGAAATESSLREAFEELGYETNRLPFSFSALPGRFGLTFSGAVVALTGVGSGYLLWVGLPTLALPVLVAGLLLALLPLFFLAPAMRRLPFDRVETANLLFTRPGAHPSWLVMAHRDSKSQLVPTLLRTLALALAGVGWLVLVLLAGLWFAGPLFQWPGWGLAVGIGVGAAGLVLALAWAGNDSPGALDNATGLAALLAVAADGLGDDVGFLVTDGEELGLAGARAAVTQIPAVQGVINVDGLDDEGPIRIAEGHGWRRKGSAPQLAAALLAAGQALDTDVRRQPLPRSIPVDHQPLAAAGIPALTVLRGRWRSLLRVHRPADRGERIEGRGVARAATVLAGGLRLLQAAGRPHLAGERRPSS